MRVNKQAVVTGGQGGEVRRRSEVSDAVGVCKGGEGEYRTRCAAAKCVALVHCRGGLLFFLEVAMLAQGRKKGRRAAALRSLLIPAVCLGPCPSQAPSFAGAWGTPFNHQVSTTSSPNSNATDPGSPFGGLDAMTFFVWLGATFGWPGHTPNDVNTTPFEAVHMSLIPKGNNRGKVLVWNVFPVLAKVPPAFDPTLPPDIWWAFQAYAIVDMRPVIPVTTPPQPPRFQNFLLPIERVDPDGTPNDPYLVYPYSSDLFCSGHCWTQFGDLVVVGGTKFDAGAPPAFKGPS
jgi:hypothetical protein